MKSMAHLNEAQLIDALDGGLDAMAAGHVASCAACGARVNELRSVVQTLEAADEGSVTEPSPLFWEQFPGRVRRAIDAEPVRKGWLGAWRWWGSAATAAVVLLVMLLPLRKEAVAPAPVGPAGDTATTVPADLVTTSPENLDEDEAWAMVRAVAEETEYDEVQDSGLSPRAGSLERAAMELSDDERAELGRIIEQDARLLKQQLKRTGASLP